MRAVPTDITLVDEPGSGQAEQLPRNARIYFALVAITAAAVTIPFAGRLESTHHWMAFVILASAAGRPRPISRLNGFLVHHL